MHWCLFLELWAHNGALQCLHSTWTSHNNRLQWQVVTFAFDDVSDGHCSISKRSSSICKVWQVSCNRKVGIDNIYNIRSEHFSNLQRAVLSGRWTFWEVAVTQGRLRRSNYSWKEQFKTQVCWFDDRAGRQPVGVTDFLQSHKDAVYTVRCTCSQKSWWTCLD